MQKRQPHARWLYHRHIVYDQTIDIVAANKPLAWNNAKGLLAVIGLLLYASILEIGGKVLIFNILIWDRNNKHGYLSLLYNTRSYTAKE